MPQAEQVQLSVLITHRTGRGSKARISQVGKNLIQKGLWFELKEQKSENAWQAERQESTQEVWGVFLPHKEHNARDKERGEDIGLSYHESAERADSADVLCLCMLLGKILMSMFTSYKQINVL